MALVHYIFFILSLLRPLAAAAAADPIGHYCSKSFKGAKTQTNINAVLSDLVVRASVGGFAVSSSGKGNSEVYGLAQCRGDVSDTDCASCLSDAAKQLPASCPGDADARIWYDYCFLRYDTDNFIGQSDTSYAIILINVENATDPVAFDKAAGKLLRKAADDAAGAAGSEGLGREQAQFTPYVTIYALAQCTRDLQPLDCAQCLASAVETVPNYCEYRKGCRVLYSSCMVRYEIYPFYFPLDPTGSSSSSSSASNVAAVAGEGEYAKIVLHP